jgi:hypothetical protein
VIRHPSIKLSNLIIGSPDYLAEQLIAISGVWLVPRGTCACKPPRVEFLEDYFAYQLLHDVFLSVFSLLTCSVCPGFQDWVVCVPWVCISILIAVLGSNT